MADTIFKYVSLANLQKYDEKIKQHIASADDALKSNLEGQVTVVANALDGEITRAKAAEQANATAASNAQTAVDTLAGKVGTVADGKTVMGIIEQIQADAYDDTEVRGLISGLDTNKADKAQVATDIAAAVKVETDARVEAVAGEKSRAEGVEAGLRTDINTVMGDYLKEADKEELQGNIDTVSAAVERLTNGVSAEEVDGVNDLIAYVKEHGTEVTGMKGDIAQNATDISGVAGRMTTAEGKITVVEGAVATKVEQSAYDQKIKALEDADAGQVERIVALEAKFGGEDGSVEDQIADAKTEAVSEATAAAATDAKNKADAAEKNAKDYADGLNTNMNTRVEALEAIDHSHANQAELDLIVTGDKAKWDEAYAKKHEHGNKAVLDGVTSAKVQAWDAAEGNAKTFAQGLNDTMSGRVTALETWHENFVECSQEDINALFA